MSKKPGNIYYQTSGYDAEQFVTLTEYLNINPKYPKPYFLTDDPSPKCKYIYSLSTKKTTDFSEFMEAINKEFHKLRHHIRRGHDIIIPYPSDDELQNNKHIYYIDDFGDNDIDDIDDDFDDNDDSKKSKQILAIKHKIGVKAGLEYKWLVYIQKCIDRLQNLAKYWAKMDKITYPVSKSDLKEIIMIDDVIQSTDDDDDIKTTDDDEPDDDTKEEQEPPKPVLKKRISILNSAPTDEFKDFYDHYFHSLKNVKGMYDKIKEFGGLGILLQAEDEDLKDVGIKIKAQRKCIIAVLKDLMDQIKKFNQWLDKLKMGHLKQDLQRKYIYTFAWFKKRIKTVDDLVQILGEHRVGAAQLLFTNVPAIGNINAQDALPETPGDTPGLTNE